MTQTPILFILKKYLPVFLSLSTILPALITGCQIITPNFEPHRSKITWSEQQKKLSALNSWHLQGKLGIKTKTDGGNFSLVWEQKGAQYTLFLSAPLSQGNLTLTNIIDNNPPPVLGTVMLRTSTGKKIYAQSAEALLFKETRLNLPVSQLATWIKGLPSTDAIEKIRFNSDGTIEELQQAGWTINYIEYHQKNSIRLPKKITLSQKNIFLKIIIQQFDHEGLFE